MNSFFYFHQKKTIVVTTRRNNVQMNKPTIDSHEIGITKIEKVKLI